MPTGTGGTVKRSNTRTLCLVAAMLAVSEALWLTGCGSSSKIVEIKATASASDDGSGVTISVSEIIDGNALEGVVLAYPDGHVELVMSGNLGAPGSSTWTGADLPSGEYSYKVYATPASADDPSSFPTGQVVETNVVASGTFTIQ
jgi:hypothetical protein